jgi:hypothetical protein
MDEWTEAYFPEVPGLDDFLAYATQRCGAAARLTRHMRIMLSMLGLGLEQTLSYVMRERPSLGEFQQWIIRTAGRPDPQSLARYIATLEGALPPKSYDDLFAMIGEMEPVLDAAELERWERDGYVILRQAITPQEAEMAADLVWQMADASPDDPASWYGPRQQGIMIQHFQSPQQEVARRSLRVHKAFAQLWGTADLWPSIDRLGFSPPVTANAPFRATPLHWDCSLKWPIPYNMFGVLYLTDTQKDQGALRLVPGFHHGLETWLEQLGGADPRKVNLDDRVIDIAAGAGDLIICRHDLPHGASPNHADLPRLVQYLTMYPVWLSEQDEWR